MSEWKLQKCVHFCTWEPLILLVSIDGVDFRIMEPSPFSPKWFSHKFRGPGIRYELAICIRTGDIVWTYGGFPCGEWPDLKLARDLFAVLGLREGENRLPIEVTTIATFLIFLTEIMMQKKRNFSKTRDIEPKDKTVRLLTTKIPSSATFCTPFTFILLLILHKWCWIMARHCFQLNIKEKNKCQHHFDKNNVIMCILGKK